MDGVCSNGWRPIPACSSVFEKQQKCRHWKPQSKGFAPKVLVLVEAFIGVTGM